jgi:hypothetical protein
LGRKDENMNRGKGKEDMACSGRFKSRKVKTTRDSFICRTSKVRI